jgi:arylsulfatase A-like enzyme/tetratricopeptide (TPR) repeat protein
MRLRVHTAAPFLALLLTASCADRQSPRPPAASQPSILLVTLDTTRADAIGPGAKGIDTPSFNALASRGQYFRQAYAAVPETLPSHTSMLTGLYPAGHGIHENGRFLDAGHGVLAEQLARAGYRTAAFVSSFVLSRRFGLSRGFAEYDDALPGGASERGAAATTERALTYLAQQDPAAPLFVWVHYFDPHAPYEPPAPFRERYAAAPYLGEVAAVDEQLGRLTQAFESRRPGAAIIVAGDHGEGLGDHGESQHGHLLYQATMHVPLVIVGPGVVAGSIDDPVSTRRVFHTALDWGGVSSSMSLRGAEREVVLGEAMKPFLEYGWRPQTMAVSGTMKAIQAGTIEAYDLASDPGENRNLGSGATLPHGVRKSLDDYPIPSTGAAKAPVNLDEDARRRLASLGYISADAAPAVRPDAPRPADMTRLIDLIEKGSALFVQERYAAAIPVFEQILAADANNLDATLRLAVSHSLLGHDAAALDGFRRAARLAPDSLDVRMYLGLHYARTNRTDDAAPLLERVIADSPDRVAAVEGLASVRERQGRAAEAIALYQKVSALRPLTAPQLIHLGELAMSAQQTATALEAFEKARAIQGSDFRNDLELGVLYLSARELDKARAALDRVPPSHPDHAMALFKRAQVSVLLKEPDRAARIDAARRKANAATRELINHERLFTR